MLAVLVGRFLHQFFRHRLGARIGVDIGIGAEGFRHLVAVAVVEIQGRGGDVHEARHVQAAAARSNWPVAVTLAAIKSRSRPHGEDSAAQCQTASMPRTS